MMIDSSSCISPKMVKRKNRRKGRKRKKSKKKSKRSSSQKPSKNRSQFDFRNNANTKRKRKKKTKRSMSISSKPQNLQFIQPNNEPIQKRKKKKKTRRSSAQTVIPSKLWLSRSFDANTKSHRTSITLKKRDNDINYDDLVEADILDIGNPPISCSKSQVYGNAPVPSGFKQRKRAKSSGFKGRNFKFAIQTNEFDEFLIEADEKLYFVDSPVLGNDAQQEIQMFHQI